MGSPQRVGPGSNRRFDTPQDRVSTAVTDASWFHDGCRQTRLVSQHDELLTTRALVRSRRINMEANTTVTRVGLMAYPSSR
jgi:hypothetical protein